MEESIETWFAAAGERQGELRAVDALVLAAAPSLADDRRLHGSGASRMLGYRFLPYQPRSAKEPVPWPLVALAAQKRHLSLYVCAVGPDGYLVEQFAPRLGAASCGKSCVRFTRLDRLDREQLAELVREAVAVTDSDRNAFSAG